MKAVVTIILVIVVVHMPCVLPCRPCDKDRRPPVLGRPCPGDINVHADACSHSTVVKWTGPSASDDCKPVTVRRVDQHPDSGTRFNVRESPYIIKYSATDGKGNTNVDLCSFKITVKAIRCPINPSVYWGNVSCPHGNFYGCPCTISCGNGYNITGGQDRRTCESNGMWSGIKPFCKPIQCPDPYPNLPDTSTNCTDGHNYNSVCSYICQPGYSLLSGSRRVCSASKMWTGTENPVCNDTQPPVINCPGTISAYVGSGQTPATVTWDLPNVTDNSNETLTADQIEGLPPGSHFSSGSHGIKYEVSDSNGNTAKCSFSVDVQVIYCPDHSYRPDQWMKCSSNFDNGSVCKFGCSSGFVLTGNDTNECLRQGETANGIWSAPQPTCEVISCPDHFFLPDQWMKCSSNFDNGSVCQFGCSSGFVLTGNDTNECLRQGETANGIWSAPQPTCEVI